MKIAQYNDMMSYLTRPGFKDGDTVVPPPKPLTESQVKNKLDLYIKGFIGGFDKMEMIDLMNKISKKADESGVMSQEDVFNFVQERKNFYQKFLEENKGEAVEFPREEFADGTKLIDAFGKDLLDKLSQEKFGVNFDNLPTEKNDPKREVGNFKRRILKFQNFIKENNRQPTEEEARKLGRVERDKTIAQTDKPEVTEADKREEFKRKNIYAKLFKGKLVFADKSIQDEFENELKKRYSVARTSGKAKKLGVLSDKEIYEKFLKPAGLSPETTRTYITNYKKILDEDFKRLSKEEKDVLKVESEADKKISQKGRRFPGTVKSPAHHLFPIGDDILAKGEDLTVIPQKVNAQIQDANKKLKQLVKERRDVLTEVKIADKAVDIKELDTRLEDINKKAEVIIKNHYKTYPNHEGLLNWKKYDFIVDDVGRLLNISKIGTIGGDYKKWSLANVDQTILNKDLAKLNKTELKNYRDAIKEVSKSRDAGDIYFGTKKNLAKEQIKNLDLKRAAERGSIDLQLLKDIYDKGGSAIGKGIKVIGSPAAGIGFALTEDNAFLKGASLLAPEILGTKGIVSKILNPFNVGRVMTPVGLPVTIGGGIYEVAKKAEPDFLLDKETLEPKTFDREDASFVMPTMMDAYEQAFKYSKDKGISYDDAVKELFKEKSFKEGIEDFQRKNFVVGGRVGYADGPDDPGKRKFLKIMGGLATLPIVGRFFRVGEIAAPVAEKAVETVSEAPKYFFDLVNKIKLLGTESKIKPGERITETNYTGIDGSQYTLTEDSVTGLQRIEKDKIGGYADENVSFDTIENKSVMEYQPTRRTEDGVEPDYYDEGTATFDRDGTVDGYDDGMEDDIIEQIKKEADDKG